MNSMEQLACLKTLCLKMKLRNMFQNIGQIFSLENLTLTIQVLTLILAKKINLNNYFNQ